MKNDMGVTAITWMGFAALVIIASLYTGPKVHETLSPPRYAPLRFVFRGMLLLGFALASAWIAARGIINGNVAFGLRNPHPPEFSRALEPIAYWTGIVLVYALGLFMASFGTALISLCWNARPR